MISSHNYWKLFLDRSLYRLQAQGKFKSLQKLRHTETSDGYSLKPFDDLQCIFVHIPKCAGRSVAESLFGNYGGGHANLERYSRVFAPSDFLRYFKFTIVRNPWDRLYSAWRFLKSGGLNRKDREWAAQNLSPYPDFESFVGKWLSPDSLHEYMHFYPQSDFLRVNGKHFPIDFVGRFENLEEDFQFICRKLSIESSLQLLNRSSPVDYREAYTDEMREVVADVYVEDIDTFSYTFESAVN